MRLKLILIFGAIATAIFVAGCGGGSGTTSEDATTAGGGNATTATNETASESKPMTKTEFHTRINEICIQVPPTYEEELKKLEKGGKKPSKAESNLKAAIPPLEGAIEQMEGVNPPANEEKALEEMVTALKSAAKGVEENPTTELSGTKSPFAEFQALSKKLGFETCSGL
jgi:hypothetical protein